MEFKTIEELNMSIKEDSIISESAVSFVLSLPGKIREMKNEPDKLEELANDLTERRLEIAVMLFNFLKKYNVEPKEKTVVVLK